MRLIDIHCHCLPGLDDGPATETEAVALCRSLVADGVTTVVATPHQLGRYDRRNPASGVRAGVRRLRELLLASRIPLQVEPGGDVRLDERIPALLAKDEILTLADQKTHLLLELPHDTFINPHQLIAMLSKRGITTVISHPERNHHIATHVEIVTPWLKAGAQLQLTAASVVGECGSEAEHAAWHWLEVGAVDFVASDAHSVDRRPPRLGAAARLIQDRLGADVARAVCSANPGRLLMPASASPSDVDDQLELIL